MHMNANKLACYFLPAFAMLAISLIARLGGFGDTVEDNGRFVLFSLYMLYPLIFLYQGFVCALKRYPWVHAIVISLLAYIVMIFMLGLKNYMYIVYYLIAFFIAYGLTTVVRKARGQ